MAQVHHMVLLKFKPTAPSDIAGRLFAALAGLRRVIGGMVNYQGGPYSSPEGLNQGYSHGFLMTFADPTARNHYLAHAEHEKVKNEFLPFVDAVVAFDFEETA